MKAFRFNLLLLLFIAFAFLSSLRLYTLSTYGYITSSFCIACIFTAAIRGFNIKKTLPMISKLDLLMLILFTFSFGNMIFSLLYNNDRYLCIGDFLPFAIFTNFYFAFRIYGRSGGNDSSIETIIDYLLSSYIIIAIINLFNFIVFKSNIFSVFRIDNLILPRVSSGFIPEIIFFLFLLKALYEGGIRNYGGLILSIIFIGLSLSRSLWIGITFTIFLFFFLSKREDFHPSSRKSIFRVFTLLVIIFILANYFLQMKLGINVTEIIKRRAMGSFNTRVEDVKARILEFKDGIKTVLKNPLGIGLGGKYYTYIADNRYGFKNYLHNTYLEVLVKMGFIGLVIFLAVYVFILKHAFFCFKLTNSVTVFGILLGIIAMMIATNFSPSLNKITAAPYLGLIFAIIENEYLLLKKRG